MFPNDRMRARVCKTLMDQGFIRDLWTEDGPTEKARELLEQDGGYLSAGERVLLLAAWGLWNDQGTLRFADILKLDDPKLHALGELLVALSGGRSADRAARLEFWITLWSITIREVAGNP